MKYIETTVKYISDQYDDLLKSLAEYSRDIISLKEENKSLRSELDSYARRTRRLEEENARQQQWHRLQNIEIVGVPDTSHEDTVGVVIKIAEKIGVSLDVGEVEFAHRVRPRKTSGSTTAAIVARLRHRHVKDSIIAASRKHRSFKPSDIGLSGKSTNGNIFINEHLTKSNKQLLKECKLKARELEFKYVWTKNCRIYVRRNDTSPPIPIIINSDIAKMG